VITRFEGYKGKYPYHCHIIEHEEHEMMRQFQTVLCGDAEVDLPAEGCDDGGRTSLDGCSARCRVEEFVDLSGIPNGGGTVQVTVSGEVFEVTTSAGQSAMDVVQALAAQINASAVLQALGVLATGAGSRLVVEDGDITDVVITDAGLDDRLSLNLLPTRLWWGTVGGATGYDVVRGSLSRLRATSGDFADPTVTEACLANDQAATFWAHTEAPAPGEGVWYLVRSHPGGTYDSGEPSQVGSRDAEIDASGNACP
jgi:cysteine-rich repeat protein